MATNLEQVAAQRGYPSHLFGYTPNQKGYWVEPTLLGILPLLSPQHYGLTPAACERELAGLLAFRVWNESMAPRFPIGLFLGGRPLPWGAAVQAGQVLAWVLPGSAEEHFKIARVVRVEAGRVWLACDHGPATDCLTWGAGLPSFPVYRITHYITQPRAL